MLILYVIHVECANVIVNHHLQLGIGCNLIYANSEI
jgi:hypothetical protein